VRIRSARQGRDLLRKTEDSAFRKPTRVAEDRWRRELLWGPPRDQVEVTVERCNAANEVRELVNNNENTSAACCGAAGRIPDPAAVTLRNAEMARATF
jgi:hypothetical protein